MTTHDAPALPDDLPAPEDDGAARHLPGLRLPPVFLPATTGGTVDLSSVPGRAVVFAYPRTGEPDRPPLTPDWDAIPGARGCTNQTCGFRDLSAEFGSMGVRVFGLSTQEPAYQKEMAERLRLPFPVVSDADLRLADALGLPTFEAAGLTLLKRLAWVQDDGLVGRVFYPVFPPDTNADEVLGWLRSEKG